MSKQRYVQDSFWTDPYIEKLSPDEKLIFLYLLTNPQCNIAGVYELRIKRMAFETGYDPEIVENIIGRLERDGKVIRVNEWVIIVNHIKHQSIGGDTATGINRIIKSTPLEVQELYEEKMFPNSKGDTYPVMVLSDLGRPPIDPLHTPPFGAYSEVKLSKVKLSSKKKLGEFQNVNLSEEEHDKLIADLGEKNTQILIEELSSYMASKGKRYSNHYATILNWARRKLSEHQEKLQTKKRTLV